MSNRFLMLGAMLLWCVFLCLLWRPEQKAPLPLKWPCHFSLTMGEGPCTLWKGFTQTWVSEWCPLSSYFGLWAGVPWIPADKASLSLGGRCQTPGHLIVDAANRSGESRQPAPHRGRRCHPCQVNGDGSCSSNLVRHHCQPLLLAYRDWPMQSTFSGSNCDLDCLWLYW